MNDTFYKELAGVSACIFMLVTWLVWSIFSIPLSYALIFSMSLGVTGFVAYFAIQYLNISPVYALPVALGLVWLFICVVLGLHAAPYYGQPMKSPVSLFTAPAAALPLPWWSSWITQVAGLLIFSGVGFLIGWQYDDHQK